MRRLLVSSLVVLGVFATACSSDTTAQPDPRREKPSGIRFHAPPSTTTTEVKLLGDFVPDKDILSYSYGSDSDDFVVGFPTVNSQIPDTLTVDKSPTSSAYSNVLRWGYDNSSGRRFYCVSIDDERCDGMSSMTGQRSDVPPLEIYSIRVKRSDDPEPFQLPDGHCNLRLKSEQTLGGMPALAYLCEGGFSPESFQFITYQRRDGHVYEVSVLALSGGPAFATSFFASFGPGYRSSIPTTTSTPRSPISPSSVPPLPGEI